MRIRRTTLEDGRYLIYYTFDEHPDDGGLVGAADAQARGGGPRARQEAAEESGLASPGGAAAADAPRGEGGRDV